MTRREWVESPILRERRTTIFIHGYHVDAERAKFWTKTMDARLHKFGYRDSIIGLDWEGDEGTAADFLLNVDNARETGPALVKMISTIRSHVPGVRISLLTHSLGAEVALAGLELLAKDGKRFVEVAAMTEAAVPAAYLMTGPNPNLKDLKEKEAYFGVDSLKPRIEDWGRYQDAPAAVDQLFSFYSGTDTVLSDWYSFGTDYTALGSGPSTGLAQLGVLGPGHQINTAPGAMKGACPICGIKNHSSMAEDKDDVVEVFFKALVRRLNGE